MNIFTSYLTVKREKATNNMTIIKSLYNVGHIHLQNFHYVPQVKQNQPWNILDIIITMVFVHNT